MYSLPLVYLIVPLASSMGVKGRRNSHTNSILRFFDKPRRSAALESAGRERGGAPRMRDGCLSQSNDFHFSCPNPSMSEGVRKQLLLVFHPSNGIDLKASARQPGTKKEAPICTGTIGAAADCEGSHWIGLGFILMPPY